MHWTIIVGYYLRVILKKIIYYLIISQPNYWRNIINYIIKTFAPTLLHVNMSHAMEQQKDNNTHIPSITPAQPTSELSKKIALLFAKSITFEKMPNSQSNVSAGGGDFDNSAKKFLSQSQQIANATSIKHPALAQADVKFNKGIPSSITINASKNVNDTPSDIGTPSSPENNDVKEASSGNPTISLADMIALKKSQLNTANNHSKSQDNATNNDLFMQQDDLLLQNNMASSLSIESDLTDEVIAQQSNGSNDELSDHTSSHSENASDSEEENNFQALSEEIVKADLPFIMHDVPADGLCFFHAMSDALQHTCRFELSTDQLIQVSKRVIHLMEPNSQGIKDVCRFKQFRDYQDALASYDQRYGHPMIDGLIYANWLNLPLVILQYYNELEIHVLFPRAEQYSVFTVEELKELLLKVPRTLVLGFANKHFVSLRLEYDFNTTYSVFHTFRYDYFHYKHNKTINSNNVAKLYVQLSDVLLMMDVPADVVRGILFEHDDIKPSLPFSMPCRLTPIDCMDVNELNKYMLDVKNVKQLRNKEISRFRDQFSKLITLVDLILGRCPEQYAILAITSGYDIYSMFLSAIDRIAEYKESPSDYRDCIEHFTMVSPFYEKFMRTYKPMISETISITSPQQLKAPEEQPQVTNVVKVDLQQPLVTIGQSQEREVCEIDRSPIYDYQNELLSTYPLESRRDSDIMHKAEFFKTIHQNAYDLELIDVTKSLYNHLINCANETNDPYQAMTMAIAKEFKTDVFVNYADTQVLDHFIGFSSSSLAYVVIGDGNALIGKTAYTGHAPLNKSYVLTLPFFNGIEIRNQLYNSYVACENNLYRSIQRVIHNSNGSNAVIIPNAFEQSNTDGRPSVPNATEQNVFTGKKGKRVVSIIQPNTGHDILNWKTAISCVTKKNEFKSINYVLRASRYLFTEAPDTAPFAYVYQILHDEVNRALVYVNLGSQSKIAFVTVLFFSHDTSAVSISCLPRIVYRVAKDKVDLYAHNQIARLYLSCASSIISNMGTKDHVLFESLKNQYSPKFEPYPVLSTYQSPTLTTGILSSLSPRYEIATTMLTSYTSQCSSQGFVTTTNNNGQQMLLLSCGTQMALSAMDVHKHSCSIKHHALTVDKSVLASKCKNCNTPYPHAALAFACSIACRKK
uniref:Nsp4 n=1 Tax=Elemess virus TaxID=2800913 RepID=A0A894KPK2_9VIRU|nr:MAG: Nsp4 [Elemess virus]